MSARLGELARAFTQLGLTAFGGPAAHIAIMQREFVDRRAWLTRERFADLLGLSSLLPGPTSTEIALGIGYERARWPGLLIAGLGFIVPASLIVLLAAALYEQVGMLSAARSLLYGMSPVVIALIVHAITRLAPTALTDVATRLVCVGSFFLALLVEPLLVLVTGALVMLAVRRLPVLLAGRQALLAATVQPGSGLSASAVAATAAATLGLLPIFLTFLKMGVVVFGSGYVLVAFLGSELVAPGYISEQELLDAIAIGQLTPGPVFTAATFIGYLLAGVPGAVVATVGIFLPSFVLVGAANPWLPRMRASASFSAAIDGLNAAAIALIAASVVWLASDAFVDPLTVGLGITALCLLLLSWLGPVPLLLLGALIGLGVRTVLG